MKRISTSDMQKFDATGWIIRMTAAALFAVAVAGFAIAEDTPNQKRQNLVDLSLSPAMFFGQTKRVFCPIESADTTFVSCFVLNERLRVVGVENIFAKPIDLSTYRDILNRCAGGGWQDQGAECAYEIDVFVTGSRDFPLLEAKQFYPIVRR